jgi:hypothetical protein
MQEQYNSHISLAEIFATGLVFLRHLRQIKLLNFNLLYFMFKIIVKSNKKSGKKVWVTFWYPDLSYLRQVKLMDFKFHYFTFVISHQLACIPLVDKPTTKVGLKESIVIIVWLKF